MALAVALAGFMGSGKTAVGQALAATLGWRFIDLDECIEESRGTSVEEIFARNGETSFRCFEEEELGRVVGRGELPVVLALGGGTLCNPASREILAGKVFVIYLDAPAQVCWNRVKGSSHRPLARDEGRFLDLHQARDPIYRESADATVDSSRPLPEVVQSVLELLRQAGVRAEGGETGPGARHEDRTGASGGPGRPYEWRVELRGTARPSLIVGGRNALAGLDSFAAVEAERGVRARIVTDENVWEVWGEEVGRRLSALTEGAAPWILSSGEKSKEVASVAGCWEWLAQEGLRRDGLVVALGGGVVGDLAGFVAATYLRGVAFWQIPTSLLAQVDSSVGGKVGVNLAAGKNLVGAFYQPEFVAIDPAFLSTLPQEELVNGLGEVVKYGLLAGDPLLSQLEREAEELISRDEGAIDGIVEGCVRYKAGVVEADEKEAGERAVLNLGHTVGHALEAAGRYRGLSHGRAVALGLLAALRISEIVLGLDPGVRARVERLLGRFSLPTRTELPETGLLLGLMGRDKKVSSRGAGFVGLRAMGEPVTGLDVPREVLTEGLQVIRR